MPVMSDKEIRNKLLESDDPKGWKYSIGEQMRDNLTDGQAAMLAYYYFQRDFTNLGYYLAEIMKPVIEKAMANEIEEYKRHNSITVGEE